RTGHLHRVLLGHVLTVDGDAHFHTAVAGSVVVKQDFHPRHRADADAHGEKIVDAIALMLSNGHRRPFTLVDCIVFHRRTKVLIVNRLIVVLHFWPRITLFPLPATPELTGTFRQRILGIGGSRAERISQR